MTKITFIQCSSLHGYGTAEY